MRYAFFFDAWPFFETAKLLQMVPLAASGASPARTKKKTLSDLARCGRAVA
jgi:hypothetical protein